MTRKPKKSRPLFNLLDWLMLAVAGVAALFVALTDHEHDAAYIVADLTALLAGVFYIILSAKGRRSNFVFCLVNALACIYLAMSNHFFGNAAVNAFYYVPCSFIGYYLWGRNSGKNHEIVARRLSASQVAILVVTVAIGTVGLGFALESVGDSAAWVDSASTIFAISANLLMILRYREQWLVWLATDLLMLAMWATSGDIVMLVLRILFTVGAVYGYINWRRLVRSPRQPRGRTHRSIRR